MSAAYWLFHKGSFFMLFIFIFGCAGSSLLHGDFFLVAKSGGYSLVAVRGILIAVAPLVAEHRL